MKNIAEGIAEKTITQPSALIMDSGKHANNDNEQTCKQTGNLHSIGVAPSVVKHIYQPNKKLLNNKNRNNKIDIRLFNYYGSTKQ